MSHEYLKTPEGRSQARQEHQAALEPLRQQKQDAEQQLAELANNNADNLAKRAELASNKAQKKRVGIILLIVGFICLVIASYVVNPGILEVLFDIVGLCIIAVSIYFFIGMKKFKKPQAEMAKALAGYDREVSSINERLRSIRSEISEHESCLAEIADRELYPELYDIDDKIDAGYAVVYATSEIGFGSSPSKPTAIKYTCSSLDKVTIYINSMLSIKLEQENGRWLGFSKLDNVGPQSLQAVVDWHIVKREPYQWQSEPYRVDSSDWTNFFWIHLSTSTGGGSQFFVTVYDTLETFLKDTGITRREFVDKFRQSKL